MAGDAITLRVFQNRFHDNRLDLGHFGGIHSGLLFYRVRLCILREASSVFGIPYMVSLLVGAVVVISYTFAGGFFAVCWTDFFQGILMFFCVLAVPTIAIFSMGGPTEFFSQVEAFNPNFLNMLVDGATGVPYTAMGIISLLAWGLGYFGQPHILVRFMGISSPQAIKKSRRIATVWVLISLTAAIMIGVSGRMFLGDGLLLNDGNQETIYI
ncbi:MAG: sodium:solute symporter family transporter, partial [Butyricicoccus sp.]